LIIRKAIRFLLLVLGPSIAFAQGTPTGSPITGDIRPISLHPGAETNVLFADISAGAAADDNINYSLSHPIGGAEYFLAPALAIQETRSQLQWNLSYLPRLRFYVPSSAHPDLLSHAFGGTLRYELTKHLAIGLRQDYIHTSDPFQQLGDAPLQPGIGLLNQPGVGLFGNFTRTQLLSQAQIDYKATKHTSMGVAGDYMSLQSDRSGGQRITGLIDTHDTLGSAYVSRQFTARQAIGMQYNFLDIVFPGRDTRTRTNGVLLFDQIAISPHTSLSIFAGPEYSRIHNQLLVNILGLVIRIPESKVHWSAAGGGMLDWRGHRRGLQASFVQRVSDGGGGQGAVEMRDATLRFRKTLARRWAGSLDVQMTQRSVLNVPKINKTQVLNLGAEIGHELAYHFWIRASYERIHRIGGSTDTLQVGNRDRVTLSLKREFTVPLGR